MPNQLTCKELRETMRPHFVRIVRDVTHGFYSDIQHAIPNLWVEFCRADDYRAGHWFFWQSLAFSALLAVNLWRFFL